jgi:hypothetical protein
MNIGPLEIVLILAVMGSWVVIIGAIVLVVHLVRKSSRKDE